MGGAVSNCSCQSESRTQEFGTPNMNPKIAVYQPEHPQEEVIERVDYNLKEEAPVVHQAVPTTPKVYDFINSSTTRKLKEVLNSLKDNKVFFDSEFPPSLDSLTKNSTQFPEVINLEWHRLGQIFSKEKILIDPHQQSKINSSSSLLGQYNPLSIALGILGSRPELVQQLFEIEEYHEKGVYSVWINFNGEWKEIIIDDQLPCLNQKNLPAFIKPQGLSQGGSSNSPVTKFEFWAPLVEKAFAKLYSSYDKLDIGTPEQIITDLTGAPYKNAQTLDTNAAWKFITSNLENKFILTGTPKQQTSNTLSLNLPSTSNSSVNQASPSKDQKEQAEQTKQQTAKYLEIIDAKEVEVNQYIREKIIKVRNPVGPAEWKGDWSATSQKWTPELRNKVEGQSETEALLSNTSNNQNGNQADSGVTWMPLESFCQSYQYIVCNLIHPNYQFYSRSIIPSFMNNVVPASTNELRNSGIFNQNKLYILPFEVKEDNTHLYLQYHIADKRSSYKLKGSVGDNPLKHGLKQYPPVNYFLFKGDEKKVTEYMREEYSTDRNGCIENTFSKGSYLAILNVKWGSKEESKSGLTISSYSDKRVEIKEHLQDINQIDLAIDQCLMNVPPLMSKDIFKYPEDPNHLERYHNVALGYSYYVYTNTSQTTTLRETAVMTDRKFLTICHPQFNSDQFSVEIKPLQKHIVKYVIEPEGYGLYQGNLQHHSIFSYSNEDLFPQIKGDLANKTLISVDGEVTQVEFYQHLFKGGLALFFLNNSNKIYSEEFKVELTNLASTADGYLSNQNISIEVQPKRTRLFVFPQIDPLITPSFKYTSIKKSLKSN